MEIGTHKDHPSFKRQSQPQVRVKVWMLARFVGNGHIELDVGLGRAGDIVHIHSKRVSYTPMRQQVVFIWTLGIGLPRP